MTTPLIGSRRHSRQPMTGRGFFTRARWVIGFAGCAAVLLAGCGGDDDDASANDPRTFGAKDASELATSMATDVTIEVKSPVERDKEATVSVQTSPNTDCAIDYDTPSGTRSQTSGLENKRTNGKGEATWTFTISQATKPGKGTVRVWCNGQDAVETIEIT